jgi:hypothetical protein
MLITMRTLCLSFLLLPGLTAMAQERETRDIIDNIAEHVPEDEDFSELTERLSFFLKHPINLNKTTPEGLKSLFFLSSLQISNFFSYLANNRLMDVLELQAIPGFDPETINKLMPFVTITGLQGYEQVKPRHMLQSGSHDLILRYARLLQQQKGFKDLPGSRYLGTAEKLLLRYRYSFQEIISAGLVVEKDAGEKLFNRNSGVDHLSAHLALFKLGRIKKLVLGDYSMQFGQGLTLWSGFAFGKGPDVTSVAAKDLGLKPYTSANESAFFRGLATTMNLIKNIDLSAFVSFRKLDASLKVISDSDFTLSNINSSGLHRTQTELKNRKSLAQKVYGATLQYITDNLNIGLISYQTSYQHQFITGTQLYNKYAFSGKHLGNTGLHYNCSFKNIYFYGEIAHSAGAGKAIINGAMTTFSRKLSAVVLHRSYEKDYHNFFSSAIGEGGETNNEKGWYVGLNYLLPGNLTWSVYGDYFKFPWLKYRVDSPSSGYEILTQLSYAKGKTFKAAVRFKREQKQQNPDEGSGYHHLDYVVKQNYRLEWNWKLNQKFNFHQRTEISQYQKGINPLETGYMLYQDMNYAPVSSKLSGNLRIAWFNTMSYNSRIYAYEDDVLYGSGTGVYSGKGIRSFINVRYNATTKMAIWFRCATFIYRDTKTIGSGLDEIEGHTKTEVKIQVRYLFQ